MKRRTLVAATLLAASLSCHATALLVRAGAGGDFQSTAVVDGEEIVVKGMGGRLYVDGIDYGPIHEGDQVEVDTRGNVKVNGIRKFR